VVSIVKPGSRWRSEKGSHQGWVIEVRKASVLSIEVRVVKGQSRGKNTFFRLSAQNFLSAFDPA
jgi:hypothetical protein